MLVPSSSWHLLITSHILGRSCVGRHVLVTRKTAEKKALNGNLSLLETQSVFFLKVNFPENPTEDLSPLAAVMINKGKQEQVCPECLCQNKGASVYRKSEMKNKVSRKPASVDSLPYLLLTPHFGVHPGSGISQPQQTSSRTLPCSGAWPLGSDGSVS